MMIRQLSKEDMLQSNKIGALAFEYPYDLAVSDGDFKEGRCWGAFDDDGLLFARMEVLPHEVYMNGHPVRSAGIAGVAALPSHRHTRGVRGIFAAVFERLHADGCLMSQLYPFKFAYYNKFGYETVYRRLRLGFEFAAFEDFPRNNSCALVEGRDSEEIRELYEAYASRHSNALRRGAEQWERRLAENPYKDKKYAYLYRRADGTPGGYFVFSPEGGSEGNCMVMSEFIFGTPDDLRGILGFLRNFEANYRRVRVENLPWDEDFSLMFVNQYAVSRDVAYISMSKIIDAPRMLGLMPCPERSGGFVIGVEDASCPWNTGRFAVSFAAGKVTVGPTQAAADIEVDERALARLVLGSDDLLSEHMKYAPGIKINGNTAVLGEFFKKRAMFIGDYF